MKYDLELVLDERNALSLMLEQIKENTVVLEFGSANGRMTKYLKENLNCDIYIVEIDKEAGLNAMNYAKDGIIGDIEKFEWLERWENISFDYILFADVLEHLYDPQNVLKQTKKILKEDGKVILSVPNIAHNSILIQLFNNIFNYTPLGLLDNTHIHFFAYNTLKMFCHYAGYFPIIEDAVYSNVGENEIDNSYTDISKEAAKALKKKKFGHVYEFVFTLQKEEYIKYHSYQSDYRIKIYNPSYYFKVYLDRGDGWSEENCITYKTNIMSENKYEIILERSEEIRAIRIDPLDVNGIFRVKKIQIESNDRKETYNLKECNCNGEFYEKFFFFETDDPQLILQSFHFEGKVCLKIIFEIICVEEDKEKIRNLWNLFFMEREKEKKIRKEKINYLKTCIHTQCIELEKRRLELEHRMKKINEITITVDKLKNEIKLKDEELIRRQEELNARMNEINKRDTQISEQSNSIKLMKEELDRRSIELNCRMEKINQINLKIAILENKVKLKDEELVRRQEELNHRMKEINKRDAEIASLQNEIKLEKEELERRDLELESRMEEINKRDVKIAEQTNEIKLKDEELERRALELEHRMEEINKRDYKIAELIKEFQSKKH